MSDIRIMAVTLAGKTPLLALATATENALHINKVETLPSSRAELLKRFNTTRASREGEC